MNLQELSSLVVQKGGEISGAIEIRALALESAVSTPEYGIFSTAAIPESSVIMSIPYAQCISVEAVMSSRLSCVFEREDYAGLVSFPDEVIALGLTSALSCSDLPWALHVSTMPRAINSSIFWSTAELDHLAPCASFHLTNLMSRQIATDWETIHQPLCQTFPELFEKASLDTYKWALSIIYSRAVGFHRAGKYLRCIPPLLDMANHSPHAGEVIKPHPIHAHDKTSLTQPTTMARRQ